MFLRFNVLEAITIGTDNVPKFNLSLIRKKIEDMLAKAESSIRFVGANYYSGVVAQRVKRDILLKTAYEFVFPEGKVVRLNLFELINHLYILGFNAIKIINAKKYFKEIDDLVWDLFCSDSKAGWFSVNFEAKEGDELTYIPIFNDDSSFSHTQAALLYPYNLWLLPRHVNLDTYMHFIKEQMQVEHWKMSSTIYAKWSTKENQARFSYYDKSGKVETNGSLYEFVMERFILQPLETFNRIHENPLSTCRLFLHLNGWNVLFHEETLKSNVIAYLNDVKRNVGCLIQERFHIVLKQHGWSGLPIKWSKDKTHKLILKEIEAFECIHQKSLGGRKKKPILNLNDKGNGAIRDFLLTAEGASSEEYDNYLAQLECSQYETVITSGYRPHVKNRMVVYMQSELAHGNYDILGINPEKNFIIGASPQSGISLLKLSLLFTKDNIQNTARFLPMWFDRTYLQVARMGFLSTYAPNYFLSEFAYAFMELMVSLNNQSDINNIFDEMASNSLSFPLIAQQFIFDCPQYIWDNLSKSKYRFPQEVYLYRDASIDDVHIDHQSKHDFVEIIEKVYGVQFFNMANEWAISRFNADFITVFEKHFAGIFSACVAISSGAWASPRYQPKQEIKEKRWMYFTQLDDTQINIQEKMGEQLMTQDRTINHFNSSYLHHKKLNEKESLALLDEIKNSNENYFTLLQSQELGDNVAQQRDKQMSGDYCIDDAYYWRLLFSNPTKKRLSLTLTDVVCEKLIEELFDERCLGGMPVEKLLHAMYLGTFTHIEGYTIKINESLDFNEEFIEKVLCKAIQRYASTKTELKEFLETQNYRLDSRDDFFALIQTLLKAFTYKEGVASLQTKFEHFVRKTDIQSSIKKISLLPE